MTKEELLTKITECKVLNEKFETLYSITIKANTELKEWLTAIEKDLEDGVIPEKFMEIIGHNINNLNLHNLSLNYYDWSRQEERERYQNERIYLIHQCSNYYQTYQLYKTIGFAEKNTVIVGANGCGKTTLANELKEILNVEDGIVIPAQKLLVVPTFDNIPTYKAEKSPFKEYQKRVVDDKRTFKAKNQDDFPYEMAREYGSEYRKVLALLIAERNAKRNEVLDNKADGTIFYKSEIKTTIDVVIEIWNDLIPHRKMRLDTDCNLVICYENGEAKQYEAYKMSDGERIILYLVGRVLQAPENSLVIVDEPEIFLHKTVVNKLWNRLEKERTDCTFIYMTHDLQFATSRIGLKCWIKSYEYPSKWDIQLIDDNEIPEQLLMELLGSCKQILFCEGTSTSSHDKKIFDVLFPNFIIYPLESCKDVINYTKAYNSITNTNTRAYGLVDSDFRSKDEIVDLKGNNVFTYHVAEIENLFLVEEFIKAFKDYHHWEGDVDKIKEEIIEKLDKEKELQTSRFLSAYIDYYYRKKHMPKGNSKAEVEKKLKDFNADIQIDKWYNERMMEIELYIRNKNYAKVIAIYNNKGLCSILEKEFGIKNYHKKALEYLKKAPEQVLGELRKLFPSELTSIGFTRT
ncbi:MAG: AAA family ATPase, partial [Aeriscardovia sp.]|nr:AAA family ATPase [Aeriscardovia sp.]MBO6254893.1 AAA family ATPase [Bacteroidaceae bacterium]MBP3833076.1 AAA family ATPase [Bacteroidaceae bacterium]